MIRMKHYKKVIIAAGLWTVIGTTTVVPGKRVQAAVTGQQEMFRPTGSDTAIGGVTLVLEEYFNTAAEPEKLVIDGVEMEAVKRVPSPYENLGIANVRNYVNIRSGPSTNDKIIGKLYKGCVANILSWEGDWVKIQSGNIAEGYIKAEYLLIGYDAEDRVAEFCNKIATVNCSVLNVRSGQGTNFSIYEKIPRGESYYVVNEYEEWVEIVLGQDDATGRDTTGFVARQYVDISYEFLYAVTIEEEQAQIEAERAAKKAEEERLAQLAREQAAKKAAEEQAAKKAAEEAAKKQEEERQAAQKAQEEQKNQTTAQAKLRQEIAEYAVRFVGNPYVWGGTSLTKGADCSGFVQAIYKQFGYTIPRVSRDQAKSAGYTDVKPTLENLLPGDLIFYTNSSGTVDHVAMYIGDGKVVHAANRKAGIIISAYNHRTPYKARRVVQ